MLPAAIVFHNFVFAGELGTWRGGGADKHDFACLAACLAAVQLIGTRTEREVLIHQVLVQSGKLVRTKLEPN